MHEDHLLFIYIYNVYIYIFPFSPGVVLVAFVSSAKDFKTFIAYKDHA